MNYQIPIDAVPNQTFYLSLANSSYSITLRTLKGNTYFDLSESGRGLICSGSLCVDRVNLIRAKYLGLAGDFRFIDIEGSEPPHYSGFNDRWLLIYSDTGFNDG